MKKLLAFMLENKEYVFEIQGHTNGNRAVKKSKRHINLGEEWNFKGSSKKLSKYRAERIKTYLIKNGIKENRIKTVGFGGDKMIVKKPRNMREAMKIFELK
ncbi:MAG: OmpA family protein [Flavobacteriales bacterium]|nr:OmpA family protein [Flavobacteriales bacterium]